MTAQTVSTRARVEFGFRVVLYIVCLLLLSWAVKNDLATVIIVAAAALVLVSFVYLSAQERRLDDLRWSLFWAYVIALVVSVLLVALSICNRSLEWIGFAVLGTAIHTLVRSVDLARRLVAMNNVRAAPIVFTAVSVVLLAASWIGMPLTWKVWVVGGAVVFGAIAVELWSAVIPYPEWVQAGSRPKRRRIVGACGIAVLILTAGAAGLFGVDLWVLVWLVVGIGALTGLLVTSNDTPVLLGVLAVALVWSSAPRNEPLTPGNQPIADSFDISAEASNRLDAAYFAVLGDSYSSGEGAEVYYAGTNTKTINEDRTNECRRAPTAWSMLLNPVGEQSVGEVIGIPSRAAFLACSGALIPDIHPSSDQRGNQEQLVRLQEIIAEQRDLMSSPALHPDGRPVSLAEDLARPRFVLVGVGGNDAQFSKVGEVCIAPGDCSDFVDGVKNDYLDTVEQQVQQTLAAVRVAVGEDVPVIAVPYPIPANEDGQCRGVLLSDGDLAAINDFAASLNARISAAADAAGAMYLDSIATALENDKAQLCDAQDRAGLNFTDLNPKAGGLWDSLNPANWAHNFIHPNERGHAILAAAAMRWFTNHSCVIDASCAFDPLTDDQRTQADLPIDVLSKVDTSEALNDLIGPWLPEVLTAVAFLVLGWWLLIIAAFQWRPLNETRGRSVVSRLGDPFADVSSPRTVDAGQEVSVDPPESSVPAESGGTVDEDPEPN